MDNKTVQTTRSKASTLEAYAFGLVQYAKKDEAFGGFLRKQLSAIPQYKKNENFFVAEDQKIGALLEPEDQDTAVARTSWLIERIRADALPGAEEATRILGQWSDENPKGSTKMLVIGIIGVAIPGVTLGKIHRRKKMAIVINKELIRHGSSKLGLAEKINQATAGLVSSAFKLAKGDPKKIEPDVIDWLYGEAQLVYFASSKEKLVSIRSELSNLGITHDVVQNDTEGIDVLAISPAVSSSYQQIYWELEAIEK